MIFKRSLCLYFCLSVLSLVFVVNLNAQERSRIVQKTPPRESQPVNSPSRPVTVSRQTLSTPIPSSRPVLTNKIIVGANQSSPSLIQRTASVQPVVPVSTYSATARSLSYSSSLDYLLHSSINSKLGIPYKYGSTGPNRYDCSGFVWSVFKDAGVLFERSSAKTFWNEFEPVEGDARFQFGTLVFFNHLGHVGIVADENGFYQASSSKGITYTPFKGYWENRIVGYRRIPVSYYQNMVRSN